jgi:hypothetical protein
VRCARVSSVCAKEMTIRSRRRTNPKLHPYMFRVCDSKTPFFFSVSFDLSSIPSLSLSLSPKLTRALLGVSTTQSPHPGSSEGERKIYIYIYIRSICFSLPFFFTFSFFLCARVQHSIRFDSFRETRVESTIISFRYLVQTQRERWRSFLRDEEEDPLG